MNKTFSMPGMTYTPVELGTIRIGQMAASADGTASPVKLDHFLVTTLVKGDKGWGEHALMQTLLEGQHERDVSAAKRRGLPHKVSLAETKLRSIPVRVQFNDPSLAIESRYEAFDLAQQRPVCASIGPGEAVRANGTSLDVVPCAGADHCQFAQTEGVQCKFLSRVHLQIEGQEHDDNGFILRTTSLNSIRTLESKLLRYHALFNGNLVGVPFRLHLRSRTTSLSQWSAFYFLDLSLEDGVSPTQAAALAQQEATRRSQSGLNWAGLEDIAKQGRMHGRLSQDPLEGALMEEFFANANATAPRSAAVARPESPGLTGQTVAGPRHARGVPLEGFSMTLAGDQAPTTVLAD